MAAPPSMTPIMWRYDLCHCGLSAGPAAARFPCIARQLRSDAHLRAHAGLHCYEQFFPYFTRCASYCCVLVGTMHLMSMDLRPYRVLKLKCVATIAMCCSHNMPASRFQAISSMHRLWRWTCMWRRALGRLMQLQRRRPHTHRSPTAYRPPTSCADAATCAATALFAPLFSGSVGTADQCSILSHHMPALSMLVQRGEAFRTHVGSAHQRQACNEPRRV